VISRSSYGNHAAQACRNIDLVMAIVSPSYYITVGLQGQIVVETRRHFHDIAQTCRNIALVSISIAPGDNRPVGLDADTVVIATVKGGVPPGLHGNGKAGKDHQNSECKEEYRKVVSVRLGPGIKQ